MAKKTYPRSLRTIENTGFSANSSIEGTRLINRDGYVNLRKSGIPFYERISIYHSLIRMKRGRFMFLVLAFYSSINTIFALMYLWIGTSNLIGTNPGEPLLQQFEDAFFFSAQTLTTVGYGHVAPTGIMMNTVASIESLVGILVFALVTGIFYGRFARPKAYLTFSHNFLIAPYHEGRALMFRLATYKNNHLTDVEAQLTLALHMLEGEKRITRFFPLKLEISKVTSLALSWTLVHAIDEESPLFGFTEEDYKDNRMELIVNIKGFDDHFSNTVQQRTSYLYSELVFGAKFLPMYVRQEDETFTILELDKINSHQAVELPDEQAVPEVSPPGFVAAKL